MLCTMKASIRTKLFSAVLEDLMQERGIKQVELGRRTGIAVSRINNYLRGNFRTITPRHLGAIVEAMGGAKVEGALIEAYLFDLLPNDCRGLIEVKYPGKVVGGKWTLPTKGLSQEFAGQLEELYKLCVSSVKVRQRTQDWIKLMREVSG
jgi:transcriptional regulator with XRE-family HTH domain